MEDLFKRFLSDKKKNTVSEIIKWLKNSNIIDANSQKTALAMFSDQNKNNVGFAKFKEVVMKFAADKKWDMETIMRNLTAGAAIPEAKKGIVKAVSGALGGFCFKKKN